MSEVLDPASDTWRFVKKWAEQYRHAAHVSLSLHGTTMEQTEFQRGRIAVLNELLALDKPAPDLTGGKPKK